jgi:hypothetical protein
MFKQINAFFNRICFCTKNPIFDKYRIEFSIYDNESDIYSEIQSVDRNVGIKKCTYENLINSYKIVLSYDNELKSFLDYQIRKYLSLYKIEESVIYIDSNFAVVRIKNLSIQNERVLRINVKKIL